MATREVVQCDNGTCKSIKKESNNWVKVWEYPFGIIITRFESEPPRMPGIRLKRARDCCGSGCAVEVCNKWLDENVKNAEVK